MIYQLSRRFAIFSEGIYASRRVKELTGTESHTIYEFTDETEGVIGSIKEIRRYPWGTYTFYVWTNRGGEEENPFITRMKLDLSGFTFRVGLILRF